MRFLSATAISRFRSSASSNHLVGFLRSSSSAAAAASTATDAFLSHPASSYGGGGDGKQRWRLFSLPRVLLPIALAASASFLSLDLRHSYALCDPLLDQQYGGMERTEICKEIPKVFFDELRNILQDGMTVDYDERYFHGKPQNSFHKSVNVPDVVVYPRSQDDVQKIIIACNKYKVPIVPYGGATSIEGHTLAPNGGVCIDMSMMKVCAYFLDINAGNDDNATCLKHAHSAQCRALEILTQNVLGFLDAIICILESFAHPGLALLK